MEKRCVNKRVEVFIVSVLIVIINLRLFIRINNIKCNWNSKINFFYRRDIMLIWLKNLSKTLPPILLMILKCGWRLPQVIDPIKIGFILLLSNLLVQSFPSRPPFLSAPQIWCTMCTSPCWSYCTLIGIWVVFYRYFLLFISTFFFTCLCIEFYLSYCCALFIWIF